MEILAIQILLTFALLLGHLIIVVGERLTRSKPALSSVVMRDLKFPKRVEPAIRRRFRRARTCAKRKSKW